MTEQESKAYYSAYYQAHKDQIRERKRRWSKENLEREQQKTRIVEQYTLDGELVGRYIGVPNAARATGLNENSIESVLRRNNKIFKGYRWQYAN